MSPIKLEETFMPLQQSGTRIDKLLAENFSQIPREVFKKALKEGKVLVNGKKVKPNYVTKEHDQISVKLTFSEAIDQATADPSIKLDIVYQHPDFLILEKPAGISVHPSEKEPTGTLANGILAQFPELKQVGDSPLRPGIVHRLDKYTSGLLLVTRNQEAFEFFKALFKQRKIDKKYTAVCWGTFAKKTGVLDAFMGKSASNPLKQSTSKYPAKLINAKQAVTSYKVLQEASDKTKSLVLAVPKTGRKHQIRVQLHSIGHPLVGDQSYQLAKYQEKNQGFKRFLLHAHQLVFKYSDGKSYQFNSPIPNEFYQDFNFKA